MQLYDYAIQGARLCVEGRLHRGDIGIRGGKLAAVGSLEGQAAETLDAQGLAILPGAIDSQVHFREPGLTHKEDLASGTRSAVAGGVTAVLEEPNTDPTTTTPEALSEKLALAAGRAWCHYGFWIGASMDNLDDLGELENLPHSPGIGEVFMASSTGPLLVADDASLRKVLQNGRHRVAIHSEDEEIILANRAAWVGSLDVGDHPAIRSVESSLAATRRILALSAETRRPVHILHVSTAEEIVLLQRAKESGLGTSCEVTPQHLTFTSDDYAELGSHIQMNTPIREARHREALWAAVAAGVFDVFGSDHAPHTLEEKSQPYPRSPSGIPGVQTMLPVILDAVHSGRIALGRAVAMLSANPARLFRLPTKGALAVGMDADLAVVDLDATFEVTETWLQSKCGWSPFVGRRLAGRPVHTFVGGRPAMLDGELAESGLGRPLDFEP